MDPPPAVHITDMDRDQLKQTRDILKRQMGMERLPISETVAEMISFINDQDEADGFLHPPDKKNNPWIEKSKCTVI